MVWEKQDAIVQTRVWGITFSKHTKLLKFRMCLIQLVWTFTEHYSGAREDHKLSKSQQCHVAAIKANNTGFFFFFKSCNLQEMRNNLFTVLEGLSYSNQLSFKCYLSKEALQLTQYNDFKPYWDSDDRVIILTYFLGEIVNIQKPPFPKYRIPSFTVTDGNNLAIIHKISRKVILKQGKIDNAWKLRKKCFTALSFLGDRYGFFGGGGFWGILAVMSENKKTYPE